MVKKTFQIGKWAGVFGKHYTDRNAYTLKELDDLYRSNSGVTRTQMNKTFLDKFDRSIRILEVGSNVGNQLLALQKMGFKNLYGIEINSYAVEFSKKRTKNINIIQGSAFDIPFKDSFFDLVFTAGVLIHFAPKDLKSAMKEIYRCSKKYIWGYEFYADKYTEKIYRGYRRLFWKANFSKIYLDTFKDLMLVKEKKYRYLKNANIDAMFLLKKK